ncbi:MAG: hypothetical protein ACREDH_15650 [Methylocella sp.]
MDVSVRDATTPAAATAAAKGAGRRFRGTSVPNMRAFQRSVMEGLVSSQRARRDARMGFNEGMTPDDFRYMTLMKRQER